MDIKSILKSVTESSLQWNNFVSDFALIDASFIQQPSTDEKTPEQIDTGSLTFL